MADNAAQSIKDLEGEIEKLNNGLENSLAYLAKHNKQVASLFTEIAKNARMETDEVVDYMVNKLKNLTLKGYSENILGITDAKEVAKQVKAATTAAEEETRKYLEIEKAYNERDMKLTEEREKQKLQAEQMYAEERRKLLESEAKKRQQMEQAWREQEVRDAKSRTDINKLGALAATPGLTGTLAALQDETAVTQLKKTAKEEEKWAKDAMSRREQDARRRLEIERDFNQRDEQLTKQREKQKTATEKAEASARIAQAEAEAKRKVDVEKAWAEQEKREREKRDKETLKLGEIAATKGLTSNAAQLREAGKEAVQYQKERERAAERYYKLMEKLNKQQAKHISQIKEQKTNLESLVPTLMRLGSAFGVAFSVQGLANFGKKLIETRGEFEMQFVAMKQIIGDVDAATKIWNQTLQQALQSPFKAMQLVDYTKKLAAYRVETEKLYDTTKRLADVSAGLGVDMGRLILAYGQVKTANYLRASEVRQFTEAGVNIYGELAKYFSEIEGHAVSTAEVVERVTKRMVLFSDVEAIFKRMTDEGGVFFNMQEVQADTVKGQIQKLHDAYDQMLNTIGQSNQGTIRDLVDSLNNLVRHWRDVQDFLMRNVRTMLILLPLIKSYQKGASLAADKSYTWGMFTNRLRYSMEGFGAGLKGTTGAMMKHRLSLMAGTTAMRLFRGAVEITKNALRTFVPFLALEGLMLLATKMGEARRAAEELTKSIDEIKGRNTQSLQENIEGFNKLKTAIEQTNDGSLERQRLIEKMNNTYGDYLPNLITEVDTVKQLDEAYDGVIQNMREYAYQKTKEEVGERLRTSMFDEYTEAVKNLTKGLGSTINYGAEGARAFKLNKSEIQDILKMIQDEVMKNPDFTDVYATNIANQVIRNYTGLNDAVVSNEKYWRQYVIEIRDQVKELQDLDEYARDVVGGTYSNVEERRAAESLREKAEKELEAENEAWAKEKESLRTTIEESVLKGIKEAREKASKVTRQEGESDEDFARRAWDAQVKADEEAQKQIRQQHTITNFTIEQKEKEHQAKLLKIRLDNQQISAREYNKQMLAIYPELDDRIKQYNDKIRAMVVGEYGEDWGKNADAIALFKQMRIGIDDVSQGVAQYQKNFAGTVENQKKIVLDLLSWRDRGYEIDEKDLQVQREKLAVYYEMAHLLGVEVKDKVIGDALFENIQGIWGQSFSGFKMPETDKLMSQMELLDKYTKKWKEYDQEYLNLIRSLEDLQESGASEETIQILQKQIEEAKTNSEAYKALIDLLGSSEKSRQPISETVYNEVKSKLGESFGFFKLEETDKLMSQMELLDKYTKKWKDYEETLKSLTKSMEEMKKQNASQDAIDALQLQIDEAQANTEASKFLIELLGYIAKATGGGHKENASKLISLIKEMRSEYDKLSKSAYGYAKSEEKVRESYKDSVKKILGKAGITDYDFTTNEGMIAALDKVLAYANKLGPEAAAEVQKYIDQLETEIEINAQVRIREDFGKQIEEMFSNYDLTIDLEKLNVPTDELVGIFNLDVTTLDKLRRFVDDFYYAQKSIGADPTDLVEQVEGYYKKIDEMEKKELRERLKTYSKYLAEGQVEALKIHLEELKKMAELDELYEKGYFTDTQYKDISNKIRKETDEKLAKNDWQQFKESDFYVTMFEDMSRVSSASIDIMIKRLKSLRKSVNDLDPKQAKEIVKAIEKLEKTKIERSPFKSFLDDWKTAAKWRKNNDNLVKQLGFYASGEEYWSKEQDKQAQKVAELRLEYEELVKNGTPEDAADVKKRLDFEEEELSKINEILEDRRQKLDQINQKQNEGFAAQQRVLAGLSKGAQYFSDLASTAGTISTEIMDMFDGVSDASKKLAKDIAEMAANFGLLVADIAKAIASEGTDVSAMIDGLVRTWNIIKGVLSTNEYEINKTIEESTNALKDLEAQLNRVTKARERAWDTQAYTFAQKELENNIQEQIRAYDAMIAAEEERKNKDKEQIRTWKQEREELFEQYDDERENLLKEFGGLGESEYKSAAEGFVDAWKSAFLETGDGLQGLQDHFDEFLQDWFVKQATMRVAGKMLEPLFRKIDQAVDQYGLGGTDVIPQELQEINELKDLLLSQTNEQLKSLVGVFGLGGEEGSLSGLAAGIQGMTEEQANILEAYWNSVRGYTANIDMNVSRIAQILGAGGDNSNPMLAQMTLVAQNTNNIRTLLESVRFNGGEGVGIRVYSY